MKKLLLLFLILLTISAVSAGNNTTDIPNPTHHIENTDTVIALESGDSNISFSDDYKGYCIEWGEHSAEAGEKFYIADASNAINKQTHDDVSNYLKVFFTYFYNESQKDVIATQHMIWKFTDNKQFSRFNQTLYNQIIEKSNTISLPDSGTIQYNETHKMHFDFKVFISQYIEYQNYFAYKIYFEEIKNDTCIQINNSMIDKNDSLIIEYQNNESFIINNNTTVQKNNIFNKPYTLNIHNCGFYINWLLICIIILTLLFIYPKTK